MEESKLIDGKYEYFAFISYKEEDAEWAKWLQRKLEHYKLPTALRKQNPELPERISPIYEYKSEAGGGRLKEVIWNGLTSSKYLIVICSPRATKSEWLNNGIRHFVDSGQEENIIPFIIEGSPKADNPDEECFPSELLNLTGDRELRGININEMGRDAAVVKVVSRMFDVKFDTLWQRYEREQRRRRWLIVGGALLLAIFGIGIGGYIYQKNVALDAANNAYRVYFSRVLAEKGQALIDDHDSYTARLLAINVLPTEDNPDRPVTPEAEAMLRNAMTHENAILRGHTGPVRSVVFSPDGTYVVSASEDKTVRLWNANTGACIDTFVGHTTKVLSAAFSPNGKKIVSTAAGGTVIIWDIENPNRKRVIPFQQINQIFSVAFSPDSVHFALALSDNTIRLRNLMNEEEKTLRGHAQDVYSVAYSRDGKYVISSSYDKTVRIWDASTGDEIKTLNGHNEAVFSALFSSDGKRAVSASFDKTIKIWDVDKEKEIVTIRGHNGIVRYASFCFNDSCIVSASADKTVRIWNATNGEQIGTNYVGHDNCVNFVSFCPSDNRIASASDDGTIRIWDTQTFQHPHQIINHEGINNCAVFSPDGGFIVSASNDCAWIWNRTTEEKTCLLRGNVHSVAFSPNGNYICAADSQDITIWDAHTAIEYSQCITPFRSKRFGHIDNINGVVFSPDSRSLAAALKDSTIRIWFFENNSDEPIVLKGHKDNVSSVDFSPVKKNVLVSASWDCTIRLWNIEKQKELFPTFADQSIKVLFVVFSPDGRQIVSASVNGKITIWDVRKEKEPITIEGHVGNVNSISFSPDGKYFVSAASDETIIIWHAQTGHKMMILEGHTSGVNSANFSPDGQSIISASYDGTIRIWPFPPLQELIDQTRERFKDRQLTPEERRKYYLE